MPTIDKIYPLFLNTAEDTPNPSKKRKIVWSFNLADRMVHLQVSWSLCFIITDHPHLGGDALLKLNLAHLR
jgi:hypothetical protein